MDGVTLTVADLVTVFGPMLAALFAALFAAMRHLHLEGNKTRELVYKLIADSNRENREHAEKLSRENREHAEKLSRENRELIERNGESIKENRESNQETQALIEKNHRELWGGLSEVRRGLADVRERVARIEGFLKLWPSPPSPPEDGNAEAA